MRFIQPNKNNPEILEVAWMWLPTFIGQNTQLLGEADHVLQSRFQRDEVSDDKLDEINKYFIDWVCNRMSIKGLDLYLKAIAEVEE